MKPKTKKIIIIAAAVIAVVAIAYFAFFRKAKTATQIINSLNIDATTKQALLDRLAYIESTWDKTAIETNAVKKGRSYQQQLVAEAAYSLYSTNTLTYDQMTAIVAMI